MCPDAARSSAVGRLLPRFRESASGLEEPHRLGERSDDPRPAARTGTAVVSLPKVEGRRA